jgi:diacylglycerol kinase (ATP)
MGLMQKLVESAGDVGRIVRAGSYSVAGLRAAIRKEAAFRQEVILFVFLAPLGAWLGRSGIERALLIGSLVLVLIVELLNSALEVTVDRISKKRHKLSGRAKDMGSAAVYLSILLVLLVWALVIADRYLAN